MATEEEKEEGLVQLVRMGFPEPEARQAIRNTGGGNLEMALNYLLGSGETPGVVRGNTSQYAVPEGRSACTCIALTAAEMVCRGGNINSDGESNSSKDIISTHLLDFSITEGVSRYRKLRLLLPSSSIEHLSADEVLQGGERATDSTGRLFDIRVNVVGGGVRQGVLSRDMNHPLGLKSVLEALVRDVREQWQQRRGGGRGSDVEMVSNSGDDAMICILVTKTPETVLCCLPSNDATTRQQQQQQKYWLVDSHPRPQLPPGIETSYAKPHETMDSLLRSLELIFPFTDLGLDVPPTMADMYNMFDLYALEGRE